VHGYSEHSGRYSHFAEFLNERKWDVCFLDLPGHGLSDGRRANIDRFSDYIESFQSFFAAVESKLSSPPRVLFGHSLGGLVVIRVLQVLGKSLPFNKAVLSSPLLGLSDSTFHGANVLFQNACSRKVASALIGCLPNWTLPNEGDLSGSVLTHDRRVLADRASDPLISPQVTVHWTREFLRAIEMAFEQSTEIKVPVGMFQAGEDRVVSRAASERFFNLLNISPKKFIVYEKMYHEILNETERVRVMEDIYDWICSDSDAE